MGKNEKKRKSLLNIIYMYQKEFYGWKISINIDNITFFLLDQDKKDIFSWIYIYLNSNFFVFL